MFDYDIEGNIIKETHKYINKAEIVKEVNYKYDSVSRLVEVDMPYTNNENMNNLNGKLPSGKKVKFRYDGNEIRIEKEYISEGIKNKTNLIIFHYDLAGNLIMESDKVGNTRNIYIYGNGALICKYDYSKTSGSKLSNIYYHWDSKGNIVRLTDKNGKQAQSYEYDPYGNIIEAKGTVHDNSFRYSSKYYDTETGLYYYGARYYNPEYGIWLSEDPIIANIFNSRDNNPYQFCYNNPNVFTDVWGMQPVRGPGGMLYEGVSLLGGLIEVPFVLQPISEVPKEAGSAAVKESEKIIEEPIKDAIKSQPENIIKKVLPEPNFDLGLDKWAEVLIDRAKSLVLDTAVKEGISALTKEDDLYLPPPSSGRNSEPISLTPKWSKMSKAERFQYIALCFLCGKKQADKLYKPEYNIYGQDVNQFNNKNFIRALDKFYIWAPEVSANVGPLSLGTRGLFLHTQPGLFIEPKIGPVGVTPNSIYIEKKIGPASLKMEWGE